MLPFSAQGNDVNNNGGTVAFDACGVSKAMSDCCTLPPPTCHSCDTSNGKCAADRAGSQAPGDCIDKCNSASTPYPTPNPTPNPTPCPTPYPTPYPTPNPTPNPTPCPTPYPTTGSGSGSGSGFGTGAAVGGSLGGLAVAGAGLWFYKNRFSNKNQDYQVQQVTQQDAYVQMQEVDVKVGGEDDAGHLQ